MAKEKRQGFQSSAGLIRYFDSESDKSLKLSPYLVIGMAIASVVIVTAVSLIWPF
ncbi:MAG: preprotein translocase subunit Sec61beta [Thermoplasmata archaeon]